MTSTNTGMPVYPVGSATISGVQIFDSTRVETADTGVKPASTLHKVDNGLVFKFDKKFYDLSFNGIPEGYGPAFGQNLYEWLSDVIANGITNSALPEGNPNADRAAYLKTVYETKFGNYEIQYIPACQCLRPNCDPWILVSDLKREIFERYDSVDLYSQLSGQGFAAGNYVVKYIDPRGNLCEATGYIAALQIFNGVLAPLNYTGDGFFAYNICVFPNETLGLFYPPNWVGPYRTMRKLYKKILPEGELGGSLLKLLRSDEKSEKAD